MTTVKLVLIGDPTVGKTSLIRSFIDNLTPRPFPSTFNNYSTAVTYQNTSYTLSIWDTAGAEEYNKLRSLSYPHTDVFMICFAVDNIRSFNNIKKWVEEIKNVNMKFLIVGLKCEARKARITDGDILNPGKGEELAKKYDAVYMECSVEEKINVNNVFLKAIEIVVKKKESVKTRWWRILCCRGE